MYWCRKSWSTVRRYSSSYTTLHCMFFIYWLCQKQRKKNQRTRKRRRWRLDYHSCIPSSAPSSSFFTCLVFRCAPLLYFILAFFLLLLHHHHHHHKNFSLSFLSHFFFHSHHHYHYHLCPTYFLTLNTKKLQPKEMKASTSASEKTLLFKRVYHFVFPDTFSSLMMW